MFMKKKSKPQKVHLETFELADGDVEDMLNDAEGIMRDTKEILDFLPSDNEGAYSWRMLAGTTPTHMGSLI